MRTALSPGVRERGMSSFTARRGQTNHENGQQDVKGGQEEEPVNPWLRLLFQSTFRVWLCQRDAALHMIQRHLLTSRCQLRCSEKAELTLSHVLNETPNSSKWGLRVGT
jgi:hypothetical protein